MKTLYQHINDKLDINEKLVINKDLKSVPNNDLLNDLYDKKIIRIEQKNNKNNNIIWYSDKDITKKIVYKYIIKNQIHVFKTIDDFELNDSQSTYLAAVKKPYKNNDDYSIYIFHQINDKSAIGNNLYDTYIFSANIHNESYFKHEKKRHYYMMYPFQSNSSFNNHGTQEFYEISKNTFDEVKTAFDEIVKKR